MRDEEYSGREAKYDLSFVYGGFFYLFCFLCVCVKKRVDKMLEDKSDGK